jgi:hypothetical protein
MVFKIGRFGYLHDSLKGFPWRMLRVANDGKQTVRRKKRACATEHPVKRLPSLAMYVNLALADNQGRDKVIDNIHLYAKECSRPKPTTKSNNKK